MPRKGWNLKKLENWWNNNTKYIARQICETLIYLCEIVEGWFEVGNERVEVRPWKKIMLLIFVKRNLTCIDTDKNMFYICLIRTAEVHLVTIL